MDLTREGELLYITSFDLSVITGPGINEREFVGVLHKTLGDRVHFVLPKPVHKREAIPNVSWSCGHRNYDPLAFLANEVSQLRVVERLLRRRRFDLLVYRLGILPLGAAALTSRHRIPFAIKTLSVGAFDAFHMQSGVWAWIGRALAPANERLYRRLASRATAIDTCTPADVAFFQRRLGLDSDRLRQIPNATNTTRFSPMDRLAARRRTGLSQFDPIIGYIGGRAWTRGGLQLLELAPRLLERFPRLGVVIVGDGEGMPRLRERASELRVQDHCAFPGLVPYDQVPTYMNAFDVGVSFDLKENTDRIGNSSQKVLQYIATGKPVVSCPGGNAFLVEERLGSIVEAEDLPGITREATRWLSLSDAERGAFADRAVRYAQQNLTVEKALGERLRFWSERLTKARPQRPRVRRLHAGR